MCSAQSTALGYGDSRPQRTGAARPSAIDITASSVVTKIVDKSIIAILVLESHRYTRLPETALSPRRVNEGHG